MQSGNTYSEKILHKLANVVLMFTVTEEKFDGKANVCYLASMSQFSTNIFVHPRYLPSLVNNYINT